jgi:hypothetical protein
LAWQTRGKVIAMPRSRGGFLKNEVEV